MVCEDVSGGGEDVGCAALEEAAGGECGHGEKLERGSERREVVDIP